MILGKSDVGYLKIYLSHIFHDFNENNCIKSTIITLSSELM